MKRRPKPSSGSEVVGKKPLWEMIAESAVTEASRGANLIALGAFTVSDFADKTGWTPSKAKSWLDRRQYRFEIAHDPRGYKGRAVRFYFPPNH
jgi:nitrous oxide reductase accessory protein NosL